MDDHIDISNSSQSQNQNYEYVVSGYWKILNKANEGITDYAIATPVFQHPDIKGHAISYSSIDKDISGYK